MEFSIIGPGADELNLLKQLPKTFTGTRLYQSEAITASAEFGEFVFQHFAGDDFDIWFSNYLLQHPVTLTGRGGEPLLELHIQFQNQFDIVWDGYGKNTLRPYQYNLSYTPFMHNKATFQAGKLYQTFDIFFNLAYLQKIAGYSDTLSKFLELVEQKQPGSLSPVDRYLTPSMISIIADVLKCDFNDRLNRFYIECKVKELLILMLGHIEEKHSESPIKLNEYDVECLYQVKDLLLADFEQKLSLKELSRKAGVNEFKLKKGFKYLFGDSVFAYRHGIRMEKAKIILLETKLPVHDIAYMTGFEYPENFQKAYKKYWGVTPAEVRKGK